MKIFETKREGKQEGAKTVVYECRFGHIYGWTFFSKEEEDSFNLLRENEALECPTCDLTQLEAGIVSLQKRLVHLSEQTLKMRKSERRKKSMPISFPDRRAGSRRGTDRRGTLGK
ncbi:MAG: hypothetical protein HY036_07855 [Nitrospirae bacterium]|nr:hypothetical protein [Nitrospirota bacterium]MBI3352479.1 hypothetical protein [Nitrospirota bacterium]